MDLATIRREYLRGGLRREHLSDNPWDLFARWMEEALEIDIMDPTAMVVATGADGGPLHQRIVLLKHFDEDGLVFYTNYDSRKGQDLARNPRVSALFPWHALERQVMVSGVAEKIPGDRSDAYFSSRPRESRLAALASAQSRPVEGRGTLEAAFHQLQQRYPGEDIPRPANWGGYRIRPELFEFWQGGAHRLHDRFLYTLREEIGSSAGASESTWHLQRLSP